MQSEKMCVVLLFGGMSSEHEVSRVSVGNFVNNIDREKYEVLTVGVGYNVLNFSFTTTDANNTSYDFFHGGLCGLHIVTWIICRRIVVEISF